MLGGSKLLACATIEQAVIDSRMTPRNKAQRRDKRSAIKFLSGRGLFDHIIIYQLNLVPAYVRRVWKEGGERLDTRTIKRNRLSGM